MELLIRFKNLGLNIISNYLYYLNSTRNSRVLGHGIYIVLYALIRLVTIVVLLKYVIWSIYTETNVPLTSQCFVSRGLVR
jgi:tellurite resistance protein TehA-like permease